MLRVVRQPLLYIESLGEDQPFELESYDMWHLLAGLRQHVLICLIGFIIAVTTSVEQLLLILHFKS